MVLAGLITFQINKKSEHHSIESCSDLLEWIAHEERIVNSLMIGLLPALAKPLHEKGKNMLKSVLYIMDTRY